MLESVPDDWTPVLLFCPKELSDDADLPSEQAYSILGELEQSGLIESMSGTDSFRYQREYRRKA